jgi:lysyl-tRNA synthetase class 2
MQPTTWQPTSSIENLKLRAKLLAQIRSFFAALHVLEVETPLLSHGTITDPNIHSFEINCSRRSLACENKLYLQTSPEFCMKRLLAAGSGSIYQICKAFRNEESGKLHNPEFTILEWYRVGFNHFQLMDEIDEFLRYLTNNYAQASGFAFGYAGLKKACGYNLFKRADRLTYQEAFLKYLQIDPLTASITDLKNCGKKFNITITADLTYDEWLNLLISHLIEPHLIQPTFIYDFPASQAALARLNPDNPKVAERFELYINGMEIANGFHELSDTNEQRHRFLHDLEKRQHLNLPTIPLDENFLAALSLLPDCSGVALGIDRLLMVIAGSKCIDETLAFPFAKA